MRKAIFQSLSKGSERFLGYDFTAQNITLEFTNSVPSRPGGSNRTMIS
jgi:hypothetical protein